MFALATTAIAWLIFVVIALGWLVYAIFNRSSARAEIGSEIELAPNRKPYYDDETLEGRRLERVQLLGVLFLVVMVVGLPLYWILEPSRQAGAERGTQNRFASWGSQLFETTENGGFNCAGCHGGMKATGGSASYSFADPNTGEVKAVTWQAPALDTVLYRFDESELEFILVYGRPFSPMSAWGLAGGGPLNDQQIETLIAYIRSIQLPRVGCVEGEDPVTCDTGTLSEEAQAEIDTAARQYMEQNGASYGEALFNLPLNSGAFSCARCHTQGWSYGEPGNDAIGAMGPSLIGGVTNVHFPNEQDMITFIETGSEVGKKFGLQSQGSGRMPAFGNMLTDEQIKAIVEYVRSL